MRAIINIYKPNKVIYEYFFLHTDPELAAQLQSRVSAIKLVLESAQLLSTAVREYGYTGSDVYKSAYLNHPSNIWARRNRANFLWLAEHALELCRLYTTGEWLDGPTKTFKYGRIHKSQAIIERCIELSGLIPDGEFKLHHYDLAIKSTPEGLAALDRFKVSAQSFADAVTAYRHFYQAKSYVNFCFI